VLVFPLQIFEKQNQRVPRPPYVLSILSAWKAHCLLASGWTAFIYILKGTLIVGRDSIPQEKFHTLVLSANLNETGVLLKSGSEDTEFMLVRRRGSDRMVFSC
jgi:redox-sensitive bicupin YhaK (pirin superfamily)